MKTFTQKFTLLSIAGLFFFHYNYAQLNVADTLNANELAQYFIGLNLNISNVSLNCGNGGAGIFEGSNTNIGIDTGIMLTTGSIYEAVGPNTFGSSGVNAGQPGDVDLNGLIAPSTTNDACVLEFDLVPNSSVLYFRYVFGSEEYPEFVNSFNDVFAFFISGPGITGVQNIAQVPGTTIPVSINNVNNGQSNFGPCVNCAYYNDNSSGATIEYDGFTTVITASIGNLNPTGTYHLKLAIADALDFIFDSGVFLEAATNDTSKISCKPPNNLQTTFMTSNKVKLQWDAVPGATRYLVRGNEAGGSGFIFEQAAGGATSIEVENLAYNKSYFWQVQCICEGDYDYPASPFTQSQFFTTGDFCEKPVGLTAAVQPTSALLSWSPVQGASSYQIKGRAVGSSAIVTLDGITNNSFAVSNLQPNTSYEWIVKAICGAPNSKSQFSSLHTFTTTQESAKVNPKEISTIDPAAIKVIPNPAKDHVTLQLPSLESKAVVEVRLFSQEGRLVFARAQENSSNQMQLEVPATLKGGVYNLQLSVKEQVVNRRLVLVR